MRSKKPHPMSVSRVASGAALLCLLGACVAEFPKDGAACPDTVCSSRGACTYRDTYPVCACADGYTGAVCSRCAEGFHRAADDSCVADEACQPGRCGPNGSCGVTGGVAECACALGYTGEACERCRAGYHATVDGGCELDQRCHATSCADAGVCSVDAGRVACACDPGRGGAFCELRTESCAQHDPCAPTGSCTNTGGVVRCVCSPGYGGATCGSCAAGYLRGDAGCEPAPRCSAASCSSVGTCSVDGGAQTCACPAGYGGSACQQCTAGFHRGSDYRCVADETCQGTSRCGANGACRVQSGSAVCDCGVGYAGLSCERCAPGYHSEDAGAPDGGPGCVLDTACRPETCRAHGSCADDGGVARCACSPGFTGAFCETNVDDCANSACNGARCIDLIDSNVCLCDGGVYAQVCP